MTAPLRAGLVGTGHWARTVHVPALRAGEHVDLVAVWGRSREATRGVAAAAGAAAYDDLDAFLEAVDVVDLAVPPDVQAPIAARAAAAGRHLLLEKPVALDRAAADEVVAAVAANDVAALVFLTGLFDPRIRTLLDQVRTDGGWRGGQALYLGSALTDDNPFNTPWRRVHGGLWDLGPHAVALLTAALGPVERVHAERGTADLTHLVLHHAGGATSTATLTLSAPEAADGFSCGVWGSSGRVAFPVDDIDAVAALTTALDELAGLVRSGERTHPASLAVGREVLEVLAAAADDEQEPR